MITIIRHLLICLHLVERPDLVGRIVAEHPAPEDLVRGVLSVVVDGGLRKWACLRCPCGCGEKIMLSLATQRNPHWTVTLDWLERPTAWPSVRQVTQCRSHYWVKRGRIIWCADGDPEPVLLAGRVGH